MLQGQSLYGSQRAQDDDGILSLGRNLFALLPEDVYDRRPHSRGAFRLVADVRLDNRPVLAERLGLPAAILARISDSGLLFEALLRWGEDAVDYLVGEFAFAFWDGARQRLVLGRDILGLRPLYYHCGRDFFAFASMPSGLHALDTVPYEVNADFIAERLAFMPHQGSSSQFRGIERVRSANTVRVTRDAVSTRHYWNPPRSSAARLRPEAYEEGLRAVLDQAITAQMRGAGKVVATQLSAGLDSSAVTASAARLFPDQQMVAYTSVPRPGFNGRTPPGSIADEGPLAAATARLYPNIEHVQVESCGESPIAALDRNFLYQQQPGENLSNSVWGRAINQAACKRGARILLKGSLGNLTISYSGMDLPASLLASGRLLALGRLTTQLAGNGMPLRLLGAEIARPVVPELIWRALRRMGRRSPGPIDFSPVSRSWLGALRKNTDSGGSTDTEFQRHDSYANRLRALASADGGNPYKGILAEFGISLRDPTGDRRVIEYTLATPVEEFIRGGVPRSLVRRAFADRLPPEVLSFRERGYQSADWHEALDRARPEIEREIESIMRCEGASDAIDFAWLKESVDSWPTDGWDQFRVRDRYRLGLLRGISAGHFIRKVNGTN